MYLINFAMVDTMVGTMAAPVKPPSNKLADHSVVLAQVRAGFVIAPGNIDLFKTKSNNFFYDYACFNMHIAHCLSTKKTGNLSLIPLILSKIFCTLVLSPCLGRKAFVQNGL